MFLHAIADLVTSGLLATATLKTCKEMNVTNNALAGLAFIIVMLVFLLCTVEEMTEFAGDVQAIVMGQSND